VPEELTYLFRLEQFGIKFGLDNIRTILARLDHPERAFRSVHIAGTNGKGSVTAMVDAALRAAGHRSARYTSPHLMDLTERFVVNGRAVTRESLCDAAARVRGVIERLRTSGGLQAEPTFFEATTAVAFELFRRAAVEIAVVEVGLGGRLDSTNVITPEVTAITSIDFDHQQYLGATLRKIAFEKAGIIKTGVPVVVDDLHEEAAAVVAEVAHERRAELIGAWKGVSVERGRLDGQLIRLRTPVRDYGEIRLALRGRHQVANAVVAVRLLETLDARGLAVPAEAVVRGLTTVWWPGRLDHRTFSDGREILMDAAHNPGGAAALAVYLAELDGPTPPLVFAAMRDKDTAAMLRALLPTVSRVFLTRASNLRSADPDLLVEQAHRLAPSVPAEAQPSPHDALAAAWAVAPRIVVAGSIFLLGDVMREIGA
jgi:dihydrofolate synthase/folylpolyglutamate synthase